MALMFLSEGHARYLVLASYIALVVCRPRRDLLLPPPRPQVRHEIRTSKKETMAPMMP